MLFSLFSRATVAPRLVGEQATPAVMRPALAREVRRLANLGWNVKAQGATTARVETRRPFNWWLGYAGSLMLLGVGGLIYAASWLLSSRVRLFLHETEDATVTMWGDTEYLPRQELEQVGGHPGGSSPGATADGMLLFLTALVGVMLVNAAIWFFLILGIVSVFA